MSTALVVVAVEARPKPNSRQAHQGVSQQLRTAGRLVRAALSNGIDEAIVVVSSPDAAKNLPDTATVLVDEAIEESESSAVRAAVDFCARIAGHEVVIVALASRVTSPALLAGKGWNPLLRESPFPIVVATESDNFAGIVRIEETAWPMLALDGLLETTWRAHPQLSTSLAIDGSAPTQITAPQGVVYDATPDDVAAVTRFLGRVPTGQFRVAVKGRDGLPIVIENAPFLDDGTPMPTRYWLVGPKERQAVGQLESTGGNQAAEAAIDPALIEACHRRHAAARDALISDSHTGPRPSGGVGGTRVGVKCLHAHLANYLAGEGDPVGRWVVAKVGAKFGGPVAAIDCGTNSTRLLILDRNGEAMERRMVITRLGSGVDETGELSDDAIDRTVAAIANYRELMDSYGVTQVRAVATSAARDASNSDKFFAAVETVLGVPAELLQGNEEGKLAYLGATAGLSRDDGPYLIVDIGGGSTELVGGQEQSDELVVVSLPMGCVRITERFLKSDPVTDEELQAASQYIGEQLNGAFSTLPALLSPQHLIGVAGTVATLATLDADLAQYEPEKTHHRELSRESVERWLSTLTAESVAQRRDRKAIEAGRADVIVGGVLVLAEVMAACGQEKVLFSERDILDGIAEDLLERVNSGE